MLDYIDKDNAIVIDERAFPGLVPGLASDISGSSATLSVASRFDIARAVRAALEISPKTYNSYVSRNSALVQERYSGPTIMRLVENRLQLAVDPINLGLDQPGSAECLQKSIERRPAQSDPLLDVEHAKRRLVAGKALQDGDGAVDGADGRARAFVRCFNVIASHITCPSVCVPVSPCPRGSLIVHYFRC